MDCCAFFCISVTIRVNAGDQNRIFFWLKYEFFSSNHLEQEFSVIYLEHLDEMYFVAATVANIVAAAVEKVTFAGS